MSDRWSLGRLSLRIARHMKYPLLFTMTVTLASCRSGEVAQPPAPRHLTASPAAASAVTLDLAGCLQAAFERQPRLSAERASLVATEDGKRALDSFRLPALLDPQIPVRRRQAGLGLMAAAAGLEQAERETVYAVTRSYFTVLYARDQERVANSVVERLSATHEAVRRALDADARDVTTTDANRTLVYLRLAETRRTKATQGVKRALVSLREAVGLGSEVTLDVPLSSLPEPTAVPVKDAVVAAALARRGELIQVSVFAQVACLEVEAQATSMALKFQTFAAGSDVHSRPVPQGSQGAEYRPGAVPPEMPTILVGARPERIKHARSLQARAEAVVETTRNLIALEAEDAFLRWEEASVSARQARAAADAGDKLADELNKDFAAGLKVRVEEVVSARILASQARSEYNEFLYKQIVALAELERITAGGFCAEAHEPRPSGSAGNAP